ncbi:MAG: hypothetical protein AB7F98_06125 [Novosphingobium sp.]
MGDKFDATTWSALLLGLYTLFAGIGALRNPDTWRKMIEEVNGSPALQLVAGLLELMLGSAVYLANPWLPADILTCIMKTIGGIMMIEALAIIGFCDLYAGFWLKNLTHMHRGWAIFTVLMGLGLGVAGSVRFH